MNVDGTDLRELTHGEEITDPFVWSPDGARIAFIVRDITACRSWGLDTVTYYCPEAIKVIGVNDSKAVLIRGPRNEWIGNLIWLPPD
jgi:Tol biopolymer transport system component